MADGSPFYSQSPEVPTARTAADALVEALLEWQVEVVFGLPGDGINGIMEALRTRQDKFASFRSGMRRPRPSWRAGTPSGRENLAFASPPPGPAASTCSNGLYDAKLGQPVLAITGMQYHDLIGTFTQQDVELDKLFQDVSVYNNRIMGPAPMWRTCSSRLPSAVRAAASPTSPWPSTPSHSRWSDERSKRNIADHVSRHMAESAHEPSEDQLARAAAIRNQGQKVCILAGRGALGARNELTAAAERLGAPVVKPLLGKAALPDDSPYTTGGTGLLGTAPSQDALETCDTLLIVGSATLISSTTRSPAKPVRCRSTSKGNVSGCVIPRKSVSSATERVLSRLRSSPGSVLQGSRSKTHPAAPRLCGRHSLTRDR